MNIDNLNKLIAHLEAQPPERINMGYVSVLEWPCGTCGCIVGHAELLWPGANLSSIGLDPEENGGPWDQLTVPEHWEYERSGSIRYPAYRVIATLKRLRDTYLATGQVVVDWGPGPGDEPKAPWAAPQVAEVIAPALPAEITSPLRPSPVKMEA